MSERVAAEGEQQGEPSQLCPKYSDGSLLRQFQGGEHDAATHLYLKYAERLNNLVTAQLASNITQRVDPEDIVQSVFRTFFRRAALGHYDVPAGEELWKLLLVIALNKIREVGKYHRRAKRDVRRTVSGDWCEPAIEAKRCADENAMTILRMVLEELLEDLPESQRSIVVLRIEGYSVEEISARTGRAKRTVERALQEFRKVLRDSLEEDS